MGNSQNKRNLFSILGSRSNMSYDKKEHQLTRNRQYESSSSSIIGQSVRKAAVRITPQGCDIFIVADCTLYFDLGSIFSDNCLQSLALTTLPVLNYLTKGNLSPRLLKQLIKLDASFLTRRDNEGDTPLHLSIHEREDIFNLFVTQPNVSINEVNWHGHSALMVAAMNDKRKQLLKLIANGADLNLVDYDSGSSALHWAVFCRSSVSLCQDLIKNGIELDIQDSQGQTALAVACWFGYDEKIAMLLYYGSDPLIPSENGTIPLLMDRYNLLEMNLRLMLFYYTYKCDLNLKILVRAMVLKSPMFNLLLEEINGVTYDESDLRYLNNCLPDIELSQFELFFKNFDYVVKDMLTLCCTLSNFLTTIESMKKAPLQFVGFLHILLDSHLVNEVIQSSCPSISTISSLVKIFHKNNLPLEKLTELVCLILSYGIRMTTTDLNAVYGFYGRCELFRIMLHMDIELIDATFQCCRLYFYEVVQESIIAHFIYDIDLNLRKFLDKPQWLLSMDLDMLLNYFADPELQEFFSSEAFDTHKVRSKLKKLPTVPHLTDLARNAARDHIIKKFKIRNCREFYTVMKWLPINDIYKKILTFERKLYDV